MPLVALCPRLREMRLDRWRSISDASLAALGRHCRELVVLNVNLVVLGLITWGGVGLVATNIAVAAVDVALILLYHQAVEVVHVGHLAHVAAKIY